MNAGVLRVRNKLNHVQPVAITVVLGVAELQSGQTHACLIPLAVDALYLDETVFACQWISADDVVARVGLGHLFSDASPGPLIGADSCSSYNLNCKVVFRRTFLLVRIGKLHLPSSNIRKQSSIPLFLVLWTRSLSALGAANRRIGSVVVPSSPVTIRYIHFSCAVRTGLRPPFIGRWHILGRSIRITCRLTRTRPIRCALPTFCHID
ncbi:hypothetical protein D3C84_602580 [compost metagenome]